VSQQEVAMFGLHRKSPATGADEDRQAAEPPHDPSPTIFALSYTR
jgi:hypothetical protein